MTQREMKSVNGFRIFTIAGDHMVELDKVDAEVCLLDESGRHADFYVTVCGETLLVATYKFPVETGWGVVPA